MSPSFGGLAEWLCNAIASLVRWLVVSSVVSSGVSSAVCGEQGHDLFMLVFDGKGQGRCAILVFCAAVRTLGEQQFDYFGMTVGGGLMQWRPSVVAGEIDVGATGNQLPGSQQVAARGSLQQRCPAMVAASVHIGAFFDEQFHYAAVTVECGPVQRPITCRILGADVGAVEDEKDFNFFLAIEG